MSYYPPNTTNNIFNQVDFINADEYEKQNDTTNGDVDLSNYVKKAGDSMTGVLRVPQIEINGIAQTQSYSASEIAKTDLNTTKLQNVTKTATNTEISDLKVPQIEFPFATQTQAFTDTDKTTILANQGKLLDFEFYPSNIVIAKTIITPKIAFTDFTQQSTAFQDIDKAQIQTNTDKLDGVENVLSDVVLLNKTLNIKDSDTTEISNTLSNYNTFDKSLALLRSNNEYRKWFIGTAGDNVNAQNDFSICVNGNNELPECVLNLTPTGQLNIKTLALNGVEQESFTETLKDGIITNTSKIDDNFIFNELDTEFIKNVKLKNTIYFEENAVALGRIGYWQGNGKLEIQSNTRVAISSTNDILLWSEEVNIGKGNTSNVINMYGTSSSIKMNGETQNHCFTDTDHSALAALINPTSKMLLKIEPSNVWSIYGREGPFVWGVTYPSTGNLNFYLFPLNLEPEMSPYVNEYSHEWNQGTKRIRIKYNMSFKSNGSLITDFFSQIKIYNSANQLINIDPPKTGIETIAQLGVANRKWIHYNDDLTIDIENGHKIFLYTEFNMKMNYDIIFDSKTVFEITEL
jgi:hypothetical protein